MVPSPGSFLPHGYCFLWQPNLLWMHVISDGVIALAYYSIPIALVYLMRKRRDFPFHWVIGMFGAFIVLCGTTHVFEIINVWKPMYWVDGAVKAATAVVSLMTAIFFVPALPRLIRLPNPIVDPLTKLPNRLLFADRLATAILRAHRSATVKFAILFIDLDGFKDVNDGFGHSFGDELLRAVAERLRTTVREGDTVARLGGDEFVLLLENVESEEAAEGVARKVLADLRMPFKINAREVAIGASVGIAVSDGSEPADALMRDADRAMYVAKARERGAVRIVDRTTLKATA